MTSLFSHLGIGREHLRVYLSPHRDDVCFSLGGEISLLPGGQLVNVYTQSIFAELRNKPVEYRDLQVTVSAVRQKEDMQFAERCRLSVTDLGFCEPAIRGRTPFSQSRDCDVSLISDKLIACLREVSQPSSKYLCRILFCPLAVGGHIDHMAVLHCVLDNWKLLRERFSIVFFEELPYALERNKLDLAVYHIQNELGVPLLSRVCSRLSNRTLVNKTEMIDGYATQRHVLPHRIPMHEAVWIPGDSSLCTS